MQLFDFSRTDVELDPEKVFLELPCEILFTLLLQSQVLFFSQFLKFLLDDRFMVVFDVFGAVQENWA